MSVDRVPPGNYKILNKYLTAISRILTLPVLSSSNDPWGDNKRIHTRR